MNSFVSTALANEYDTSGIYGAIFHYSLIFALIGSTLLALFYFWRKGQLTLDEEPKLQMMRDEEKERINEQ